MVKINYLSWVLLFSVTISLVEPSLWKRKTTDLPRLPSIEDTSMEDMLQSSVMIDFSKYNEEDEFLIKVLNDEGRKVCDGVIKRRNIEYYLTCTYDKNYLKAGSNTFYTSVYLAKTGDRISESTSQFESKGVQSHIVTPKKSERTPPVLSRLLRRNRNLLIGGGTIGAATLAAASLSSNSIGGSAIVSPSPQCYYPPFEPHYNGQQWKQTASADTSCHQPQQQSPAIHQTASAPSTEPSIDLISKLPSSSTTSAAAVTSSSDNVISESAEPVVSGEETTTQGVIEPEPNTAEMENDQTMETDSTVDDGDSNSAHQQANDGDGDNQTPSAEVEPVHSQQLHPQLTSIQYRAAVFASRMTATVGPYKSAIRSKLAALPRAQVIGVGSALIACVLVGAAGGVKSSAIGTQQAPLRLTADELAASHVSESDRSGTATAEALMPVSIVTLPLIDSAQNRERKYHVSDVAVAASTTNDVRTRRRKDVMIGGGLAAATVAVTLVAQTVLRLLQKESDKKQG